MLINARPVRTSKIIILPSVHLEQRHIMADPSVFSDRTEAGRKLGERLIDLKRNRPVVLAVPRGGVPIAAEIARLLRAPLDLIMACKISVPLQPGLALGAIAEAEPVEIVMNDRMLNLANVPSAYVTRRAVGELAQMRRRGELYLGQRPPIAIERQVVILADDGAASGATMMAAAKAVRRRSPKRLIIALPAGAPEAIATLQSIGDEVHCLLSPAEFGAVGLYFKNFTRVGDREVIGLLRKESEGEPS